MGEFFLISSSYIYYLLKNQSIRMTTGVEATAHSIPLPNNYPIPLSLPQLPSPLHPCPTDLLCLLLQWRWIPLRQFPLRILDPALALHDPQPALLSRSHHARRRPVPHSRTRAFCVLGRRTHRLVRRGVRLKGNAWHALRRDGMRGACARAARLEGVELSF